MILALLAAAITSMQVRESVDPLTDAKSISAFVVEGEASISFGCTDVRDRKSFRLKIQFPSYIGDATAGLLAGGREVAYRFDDRAASTVLWHSHANYVFATPPATRPVLFATEMRNTTRLIVRTANSAGEMQTITLGYSDPTAAIDDVLSRCGFSASGGKAKPPR